MKTQTYHFFLLVAIFTLSSVISGLPKPSNNRDGKLFSVFTFVRFKNEPCESTSASNGGTGFRNGTCRSASECTGLGGSSQGSCAQGYGVCCLIMATRCGATITQNETYLQNPDFPSSYVGTDACSYTINKCDTNICYLRLDFDTFTINGPADSLELGGGVCQDTMTTTLNTGFNVPVICGSNNNQHMYLDIGRQATDDATLNFNFGANANAANRMWDIKVSQIPCSSTYTPPEGCLQYHTGLSGTFQTFNFPDATTSHLANQQYSVCIRQELGYCCVEYQVCPDPMSFSIGTQDQINPDPDNEQECYEDYLLIEGSDVNCRAETAGSLLLNRYCGLFFNDDRRADTDENGIVCDCTPPFYIGVRTDGTDEDFNNNSGNQNALSRGACLQWRHLPC